MLHFNLSTNVTYVLDMNLHSTYKNYNNFILSSNVKLQTYRPYHNSSFFIVCSVYIFIPFLKSRHDKLIEYRLIDILFRYVHLVICQWVESWILVESKMQILIDFTFVLTKYLLGWLYFLFIVHNLSILVFGT